MTPTRKKRAQKIKRKIAPAIRRVATVRTIRKRIKFPSNTTQWYGARLNAKNWKGRNAPSVRLTTGQFAKLLMFDAVETSLS